MPTNPPEMSPEIARELRRVEHLHAFEIAEKALGVVAAGAAAALTVHWVAEEKMPAILYSLARGCFRAV